MPNINMVRVKARLKELFSRKIDMSDFTIDYSRHFETRAIAALALMMNSKRYDKMISCEMGHTNIIPRSV